MTQRSNTPPVLEPVRLADGNPDDPVLDELGRWFAGAAAPSGLDAQRLARVARRLEGAEVARRTPWRSVALAAALVVVAGGAAAEWGHSRGAGRLLSIFARGAAAPAASGEVKRRGPSKPERAHATEAPAEVRAPAEALPSAAPALDGVGEGSDAAASSHFAAVGSVPAASASANAGELARESAALERALTALRREHDAAGALALLDRYAADFPAGELRLEADVARVDANLALGKDSAALALLDRLPLEHVGRGLELRLVRAELTATRDCGRANLDFDRVLASHPAPAFDERALFGRASCRQKVGDASGSRADLETYLARYPEGRFAAAARAQTR
ncbi:MAG TPA: hypothetical protein VMI54_02685 [Polyangiaceae bacterium]|nr:hypothetical protein [Polyangiaceae bacterium]